MQARGPLDYSTEAKPGLVITEESDGFVAYRKKKTFSHWLLMGFANVTNAGHAASLAARVHASLARMEGRSYTTPSEARTLCA